MYIYYAPEDTWQILEKIFAIDQKDVGFKHFWSQSIRKRKLKALNLASFDVLI